MSTKTSSSRNNSVVASRLKMNHFDDNNDDSSSHNIQPQSSTAPLTIEDEPQLILNNSKQRSSSNSKTPASATLAPPSKPQPSAGAKRKSSWLKQFFGNKEEKEKIENRVRSANKFSISSLTPRFLKGNSNSNKPQAATPIANNDVSNGSKSARAANKNSIFTLLSPKGSKKAATASAASSTAKSPDSFDNKAHSAASPRQGVKQWITNLISPRKSNIQLGSSELTAAAASTSANNSPNSDSKIQKRKSLTTLHIKRLSRGISDISLQEAQPNSSGLSAELQQQQQNLQDSLVNMMMAASPNHYHGGNGNNNPTLTAHSSSPVASGLLSSANSSPSGSQPRPSFIPLNDGHGSVPTVGDSSQHLSSTPPSISVQQGSPAAGEALDEKQVQQRLRIFKKRISVNPHSIAQLATMTMLVDKAREKEQLEKQQELMASLRRGYNVSSAPSSFAQHHHYASSSSPISVHNLEVDDTSEHESDSSLSIGGDNGDSSGFMEFAQQLTQSEIDDDDELTQVEQEKALAIKESYDIDEKYSTVFVMDENLLEDDPQESLDLSSLATESHSHNNGENSAAAVLLPNATLTEKLSLPANASIQQMVHRAALVGDEKLFQEILFKYPNENCVNMEDPGDHSTPLHKASSKNRFALVKSLLNLGANINARDQFESTALHYAAANGCMDCLQILCQNGAQINIRDRYGYAPLHLAVKKKCYRGTDILLLNGADINLKRSDGTSALHYACETGDFDTVKWLMTKEKIIVNSKDKRGETPLMRAASNGHVKIVEFFLTKCRDRIQLNATDERKQNILHRAAIGGYADVLMLVACVDAPTCSSMMNEQDSDGRTPLHFAAMKNQFRFVKTLCTMDAKLTLQDKHGNTPVVVAFKHKHMKVARYLYSLLSKSDLIKKNKNNDSILALTQLAKSVK